MNIIFGDAVKELPDNLIVLELDTFRTPDSARTETAYCVIEQLSVDEFATLQMHKKLHHDLMRYFQQQEWQYCEDAVAGLQGRWNGELDSFYADLLKRITEYKQNPPGETWNGTRIRI
jgi:hypothetical protein